MIVKGRRSRRIMADEDIRDFDDAVEVDEEVTDEEVVDEEVADEDPVQVSEEASELLFSPQEVGELIYQISEKPVDVYAEDDSVTFSVDGVEYTVEAEGDEEELVSATSLRGRRPVSASSRVARRAARRPVSASSATAKRVGSRSVRKPVKSSTVRRASRVSASTERRPSASARRVRRSK